MKDSARKAMFAKGDRIITKYTDRKATVLKVNGGIITVKFDKERFDGTPEYFRKVTGVSKDYKKL